MELVLLLMRLWRRRIAVGCGLLAAVAIAFALGPAPDQPSSVAWSRVLVDTTESQLLVAAPKSAETLLWRAEMLTHVMTTADVSAKLARRIGVPADALRVIEPQLGTPLVRTSLAFSASEAAQNDLAPYVVQLQTDASLPLITLTATAPTAPESRQLAEATVVELEAASSRGGRYDSPILTAGGEAGTLEAFSIKPVGRLHEETVVKPGGYVRSIGLALFFFLTWASAVAVGPELLRALRASLLGPPAKQRAAPHPGAYGE